MGAPVSWPVRAARGGLPAALLGVIFLHYQWSASSSGNPFRFGEAQSDYYNLLADALSAGQLSLRVTPSPELARLPDPYDPVANEPYRTLHDVSYFEGRFYLYFGVAPALVLFLPFRWLFGFPLPEGFAVVLFMFGGLAFGVAILRLLVKRHYPETPTPLRLAGLLLCAFSNFAPFILRRPGVYEVAVSAGHFFTIGACYWLLRGLAPAAPRPGALALASLWLGLAVASRPHLMLLAPALVAAVVVVAWAHRPAPPTFRRAALACVLPLMLCGLGLAWYNHARFGTVLEFGQSYILGEYNHPRLRLFSVSYLPSHLFVYLLAPPSVGIEFPFVRLYPAFLPELPHPGRVFDAISGLLPCVPLAGLAFLSPLFLLRRHRQTAPLFPAAVGVGLMAGGVVVVLMLSCYLGASARYFADFAPLLLLSSSLTWIHLHRGLAGRPRARSCLHLLLGLLLTYGTAVNLAVGLTGFYDLFRKRNPAAYAAIEDRFVPLQRLILRLGSRYGPVRITVRFPPRPRATTEALLGAGRGGTADALCVTYHGPEAAVFKLHVAGEVTFKSPPVRLDPGRDHVIDLVTPTLLPPVNPRILAKLFPADDGADPRSTVRFALDGTELISRRIEFTPEPSSLVAAGRDPAGPRRCAAFSGEVREIVRVGPR